MTASSQTSISSESVGRFERNLRQSVCGPAFGMSEIDFSTTLLRIVSRNHTIENHCFLRLRAGTVVTGTPLRMTRMRSRSYGARPGKNAPYLPSLMKCLSF